MSCDNLSFCLVWEQLPQRGPTSKRPKVLTLACDHLRLKWSFHVTKNPEKTQRKAHKVTKIRLHPLGTKNIDSTFYSRFLWRCVSPERKEKKIAILPAAGAKVCWWIRHQMEKVNESRFVPVLKSHSVTDLKVLTLHAAPHPLWYHCMSVCVQVGRLQAAVARRPSPLLVNCALCFGL